MTAEERIKIGEQWLILAQVYGKELSTGALRVMLDAIDDLPFLDVMSAMKDWMRTSKLGRHPLPAEIIAAARPQADARFLGTEISRRIEKSRMDHGYYWDQGILHSAGTYWETRIDGKTYRCSSFKEAVIHELGEIAWHTIHQRGGWAQYCLAASEMQEGQHHAQLRDHVEAVTSLARGGVETRHLEMPSRQNSGDLTHAGDIGKILDFTKKSEVEP